VGVAAAGGEDTSMYQILPLILDAQTPDTSTDSGSSFTVEACCTGSTGIFVVGCNVAPPCGCPAGTNDGGAQGDGTTLCLCPE